MQYFLALVFVLLLGGAYVLYGKLAQSAAPNQLSVQGGADGQTFQQPKEPQQDTDSSREESTEPEKVLVPDFTVYDSEGNEVHLFDFIGKPIVLNFWASWCGPCKMEMTDFDDAYAELGEDIHFLMQDQFRSGDTGSNQEDMPMAPCIRIAQDTLNLLDANKVLVRSAMQSDQFPLLLNILSEQMIQDMRDHFQEDKQNGKALPLSPELMAHAYTGALIYICRWWIQNKEHMDKETLVNHIAVLLKKYTEGFLVVLFSPNFSLLE